MSSVLSAASDALLAGSAAWAALASWRRRHQAAAIGFGLLSLAASAGSLRYGGLDALVPLHRWLSGWAGWSSLALLALAWRRWTWTLPILVCGALASTLALGGLAQQIVNIAALLAIVLYGQQLGRLRLALGGALGFALAGLLIGTEGHWGPIARLDLYHLSLAAAVWALYLAQQRKARTVMQ